jgi:hypothetical protein
MSEHQYIDESISEPSFPEFVIKDLLRTKSPVSHYDHIFGYFLGLLDHFLQKQTIKTTSLRDLIGMSVYRYRCYIRIPSLLYHIR